MKDFVPAKRHTFILALIRQMCVSARDDIAEMFIRRVGIMHKSAREELQTIQARQRELSEELVATLEHVLEILSERLDDADTGPSRARTARPAWRSGEVTRGLRGDSGVERRESFILAVEAIQ